ncbi:hypothetical protein CTI12_AA046340 [Artemisia annua]|uniref:Uncharacterized protein n=1 Tax=Artemisia annua TaxID=35608 RepID=A0A2U1PN08_ARTAN|nr:hypothetical protein CTI12_AA046340 [Artemisia annua]
MSCSGSSTSSELNEKEQALAGISPGLVRMSIGYTGTLEQMWNQFNKEALKLLWKICGPISTGFIRTNDDIRYGVCVYIRKKRASKRSGKPTNPYRNFNSMSGGNVVAPFNMFDAPVLPYNHLDSGVPPTPLGDNSVGMESVYTSGRRGLARGLSEDHHVEIDQNAMHLEPNQIVEASLLEKMLSLLMEERRSHSFKKLYEVIDQEYLDVRKWAVTLICDCVFGRMIPGPNGIGLDVWNDGIFKEDPLRYEDGVILHAYIARLPLKDLIEHVKRYTECAHIFGLYYRMPNTELDKGLVKLDCNWECNRMYELAKLFGKLEVYVNHTDLDFSKYLSSTDPGIPTSKYRAADKKRTKNYDSVAATVAANMATKNVKSLNHTVITQVCKVLGELWL